MTSRLVVAKVDLEWADNQYWITLTNVIGELNKLIKLPEQKKKEKLKPSEAQKYIK